MNESTEEFIHFQFINNGCGGSINHNDNDEKNIGGIYHIIGVLFSFNKDCYKTELIRYLIDECKFDIHYKN